MVDPRPDGLPRGRRRVDPRTAVLAVSGFCAVLLISLASLIPVPYVILQPGPVTNTLSSIDGKPLIAIKGHATYPTGGSLDLLTVSIRGGPGYRVSLWQALQGWLSSSDAVVPEESIYPSDLTQQQVQNENAAEMTSSQEDAKAAALAELGIEVPTTLTVATIERTAPASGVLKKDDVITAVDGRPTPTLGSLRAAVNKVKPGQSLIVTVLRQGELQDFPVTTTKAADGRTLLGVAINPTYKFPFSIDIQLNNVGGPSAGMMFALGIIDKLTPGELNGGKQIAGTGTIDPDGTVGAIGGIQQKLVGAARAGAVWFLAPKGNCDEVVGHVPDGLRVVRVATLHDARTAVEDIAAGHTSALPSCSSR